MLPGTIIDGKFRVERELGAGGMGVVVVATHLVLRQQVAIKVLRDELASDPVAVERFLREGQSCAQLRSQHVCRVSDVGTLPSGAPYLVMELLSGSDLSDAIKARPLTIPEAVDAVRQACDAIGEAHALGIIHRDLKPSNLFVVQRPNGAPMIKVLDFGIAKTLGDDLQLTQTAAFIGSPVYMSPEQLTSARDVDSRTDIWSLGVILYQCVSRALPFPATTLGELVAQVMTELPRPLTIEPRFDAVVMRCLEKDRERRYPTVAALVADLDALRTGQQLSPEATRAMAIAANAATVSTHPGHAHANPMMPAHAHAPAAPNRSLALGIGIGALAIAALVIAFAARDRGQPAAPASGSAARAAPLPSPGVYRAQAFARAMADRRCDEALTIAAEISPAHVDQARSCKPLPVKNYPETLEGANDANMDGNRPRAFQIAEKLLAKTPTDPPLLLLAGLLACQLNRADAARRYVPQITPLDMRDFVREQCRLLGIPTP